MCEQPVEGRETELAVTVADDADADAVAASVAAAGGTVDRRLRFGTLAVRAEETAVADICGIDGIETVETGNTLGIGGDSGEDV